MMTVLLALHFMVCFVLIAVVLLQRGKGADLGAALGGGGANTVFGSRGAGNFLTKLTTASAVVFMLTSISLAYVSSRQSEVGLFDRAVLEAEQAEQQSEANPGGSGTIDPGLEEVGALEEIEPAPKGADDTTSP